MILLFKTAYNIRQSACVSYENALRSLKENLEKSINKRIPDDKLLRVISKILVVN